MIIVDTPFHITFSSLNELPSYACTGRCKKVFWNQAIEDHNSESVCSQCGSGMSCALVNVHFKVLAKSNRNLKVSDFKKYGFITSNEKKKLQSYLEMNATIAHLSNVKPKFIQRAKDKWMSHGLNTEISLKT